MNQYVYVGNDLVNHIDHAGFSSDDVTLIQQIFLSTVDSMTEKGLRNTNPIINNQQRFWGRLTGDVLGDSRKMDCGEQTDYMNSTLGKGEYDDEWFFRMDAGIGHAWGIAVPLNSLDPVIWYDTRSDNISVGSPCSTCSPWFGDSVYGDSLEND